MASQDFFMRQVEGIGDVLAGALFGKRASDSEETVYDTRISVEGHTLLIDLRFLVMQGALNAAEDLLFARMEADRESIYMEVSRQFYTWLEGLSDRELADDGYSREEIDEGRQAVRHFYDR